MAKTEAYSPTTQTLLNMIASLRTSIANAGQSPVTDSTSPTALAKTLSSFTQSDQTRVNNAKAAIGSGRTTIDQLPADVRRLVESDQSIKDTTGPVHRGFFGSLKHDVSSVGGDALSRVGDVLSRGQYAVAGGVKHAFDEAESHPGNVLSQIGEGAKGFVEGAGKGVTGKEKESFSDYFQHTADVGHYIKLGYDQQQAVDLANKHPGVGHANRFLKSAGGLAGDIFLDPTTYIGAGAVGKVIRGAKYAKDIEEAGKAGATAEKLGVATKDEINQHLGANLYKPGQKFTKRQLPTTKSIVELQQNSAPTLHALAKASGEKTFNDALEEAKKTVPFPTGLGKTTAKNITVGTQATADRRLWENQLRAAAHDAVGGGPKELEEAAFKHLTSIQHSLVEGKSLSRELGITIGGKRITAIPVERLAKKAYDLKASDGIMGKATKGFQKRFVNSAGLRPDLREYKVAAHGAGSYLLRMRLHQVHDMFDKMTNADMKRVNQNYLDRVATPVLNHKGEDVTKELRDTITRVQEGVKPLTGDLTAVSELRNKLPSAYRNGLSDKDIFTFDEKGHKVLREDWLDRAVQGWMRSDSWNVANPAHIMYYLDAAFGKALTHVELLRTIADHFGVAIRQKEKKFGSAQPYVEELGRQYKELGYKQARRTVTNDLGVKNTVPIPYLQGHVFDPETAEAIQRLDAHMRGGTAEVGDVADLLKVYDKGLRVWKSLVTKYNPGYYERNLFGEVLAGFFGGVNNPNRYMQAARVMHGRDKTLLGDGLAFGGKNLKKADIRAANALSFKPEEAGAKNLSQHSITFKDKSGTLHRITDDQWFHNYVKYGLKTAFIHEDLDVGLDAAKRPLTRLLQHGNTKIQGSAEYVEDLPRMAHFIDATGKNLKRGMPLDEAIRDAATQVRKFHFDFGDFTSFEKNAMSRAFPFYKWTRKNIPLMMEMTLTHPGKSIVPLKTLRGASVAAGYDDNGKMLPQGDMVVPDWLSKDSSVPVGKMFGKNTNYLDAPVPWQQAWEEIQAPLSTEGIMQSPLLQLKSLIETGKFPSGQTSHGMSSAINTLPEFSIIRNLLSGHSQGKSNLTTLTQYLTGLGIQENTENRMYAEAKRRQQQDSVQRQKYKKQSGIFISTRHSGE